MLAKYTSRSASKAISKVIILLNFNIEFTAIFLFIIFYL